LPFTLDPIEIRLNGIVSADILLGAAVVTGQAYGTAHLDSPSLGQFGGYDVLDARFGGGLTVTPEPATILLLSLGGLVLLRKRQGGR
ncbi:MAG: PEP-CTERM sorting domain-containing protein, partial [Planctomycetota bacterium]